jgi:hypothetical protein
MKPKRRGDCLLGAIEMRSFLFGGRGACGK